MSIINTLDGLRFYEYGPILSHLNSEVEIKNLYRILQVIAPLLGSLGLKSNFLDAGGTARNWDTVEWTRQINLADAIEGFTDWRDGKVAAAFFDARAVNDPNLPFIFLSRSSKLPDAMKAGAPIVLKWRWFNEATESGTNDVRWRIQYAGIGPSGLLPSVTVALVTETMALDQPAQTVIESSLELNVAILSPGDILQCMFEVTEDGTTDDAALYDIVLPPWVEITQVGLSDTGSAS